MIKKTDVQANLADAEQAAYQALELRIDSALAQHDERTVVEVNGVSRRVIEEVKKQYTQAGGWKVGYTNDHDGALLTFT